MRALDACLQLLAGQAARASFAAVAHCEPKNCITPTCISMYLLVSIWYTTALMALVDIHKAWLQTPYCKGFARVLLVSVNRLPARIRQFCIPPSTLTCYRSAQAASPPSRASAAREPCATARAWGSFLPSLLLTFQGVCDHFHRAKTHAGLSRCSHAQVAGKSCCTQSCPIWWRL